MNRMDVMLLILFAIFSKSQAQINQTARTDITTIPESTTLEPVTDITTIPESTTLEPVTDLTTATPVPFFPRGLWIIVPTIFVVVVLIVLIYCFLKHSRKSGEYQPFPEHEIMWTDREKAGKLGIFSFAQNESVKVETHCQTIVKRAELEGKVKVTHNIITSTNDLRSVEPCLLALVFVWSDERKMILEDPRYHMAEKKRLAVNLLIRQRCQVYLIIYDDDINMSEELYNPRLGQIRNYEMLQSLANEERIISFKDNLSDLQMNHLVKALKDNFQERGLYPQLPGQSE